MYDSDDWNRLDCSQNPLSLTLTLMSGQSFRWRRDPAGVWWGTIDCTGFALYQSEGDAFAPIYWRSFPDRDGYAKLYSFFRLGVNLSALYDQWIDVEPSIERAVAAYCGLRTLRQPPEECFFAFQCATCNSVIKIERSVRLLAERYGQRIETPDLAADGGVHLFAFPTIRRLSDADEAILRGDLWGYRAPRVIALAKSLCERPDDWLLSLRTAPYAEAKAQLTALHGIGEKIADCICLFALDKDEAIPVDTHVRQIAVERFVPHLAGKSLTPRVYRAISDAFQARFGAFAGWAQQYLFMERLRWSAERSNLRVDVLCD